MSVLDVNGNVVNTNGTRLINVYGDWVGTIYGDKIYDKKREYTGKIIGGYCYSRDDEQKGVLRDNKIFDVQGNVIFTLDTPSKYAPTPKPKRKYKPPVDGSSLGDLDLSPESALAFFFGIVIWAAWEVLKFGIRAFIKLSASIIGMVKEKRKEKISNAERESKPKYENIWEEKRETRVAHNFTQPPTTPTQPPTEPMTTTTKPNFCKNCGTPVSPDTIFCANCGKHI